MRILYQSSREFQYHQPMLRLLRLQSDWLLRACLWLLWRFPLQNMNSRIQCAASLQQFLALILTYNRSCRQILRAKPD